MTDVGDTITIDDAANASAAAETLPLEGLLLRQMLQAQRSLRTAFPAAITQVQADQTVTVQPLLQVRYVGQPAASAMPHIQGVPVVMPQGATYRASWPLAVGDTGLVIVADRSLDAWLAGTGALADPQDTRCHHIADAIFVPGLVPTALQTTDTGTDMVLGNGVSTLRLKKTGQISVNNSTQELVHVLNDGMQTFINTLSALQSALVLGPFGPSPFIASTVAQFAQLQAQMTSIITRLQTFKV